MHRTARFLAVFAALMPWVGLTACAPQNTNSTYSSEDIGRTATITYGRIVSMRPVAVQADNTGVGAVGGAAVGGVAGSFLGGNNLGVNILGAVGGALAGGLLGNTIEGHAGHGAAVEFIIRQDDGQTISVVQTDEDNFQPGQRIVLTRGARTRIAHATG